MREDFPARNGQVHGMTSTLAPAPIVTDSHRQQFKERGFFVLENVLPPEHLELLRGHCQQFIDEANAKMDENGTDTLGISHRNKRYFVGYCYQKAPALGEFIFSELMAEVCRATLGENAALFFDQYVVKAADPDSHFSWHQDSGYVHLDCPEYLTCWITLDDVSEENGTVYVLPYDELGIRTVVKHVKDPVYNDLVGYFGKEPGVPIIAPAGSIAVFSSYLFHRSGANLTENMRRIYLAQYSPETIRKLDGSVHAQDVPFLREGEIVWRAGA